MAAHTFFQNLPNLTTKRLLLRKLTITDAPDIFEFTSIPEITMYLTWENHQSVCDTEHFIQSVLQKYQRNEASQWAVVWQKTAKVIGITGFISYFEQHARAEIAYILSPQYWKKGIITESLLEVLRFGFETMHLNRIEAKCEPDNLASENVMQKIGMTCEGMLRKYLLIKGAYRDYKIYSILHTEYYANKDI